MGGGAKSVSADFRTKGWDRTRGEKRTGNNSRYAVSANCPLGKHRSEGDREARRIVGIFLLDNTIKESVKKTLDSLKGGGGDRTRIEENIETAHPPLKFKKREGELKEVEPRVEK